MAQTRRTNSTRQFKKTGLSTDQLAEQLATSLTISNPKGKQNASAVLSDEDLCLSAMRSVNSSSQALSTAVQSGWKQSSGTIQSKSSSTVTASATSAAKHLNILRSIRPNDVEVERAAMSVLTKLVALEMFEGAMSAIEELHPRLCSLLNVTPLALCSPLKLHLLSIPIPSSDPPLDTILLTLASTYLSYALSIFSHIVFTPAQSTKDNAQGFEVFAHILTTTPSLISWVPIFSSLPVKYLDSALTRTYTTLTKACTTCKSQPKAVFQLRTYAATCLAHTSSGTVEPDTFWDQICRFGGAFIKSRDSTEEQAMSVVLSTYSDLINRVEKRSDRDMFMAGKGFIGFCEYWMAFAKKAGDICVLDRISNLMAGPSVASCSSDPATGQVVEVEETAHPNSEGDREASRNKNTHGLEGARICATLSQITVVLEQKGQDLIKRTQETMALIKRRNSLVELLAIPEDADEQSRRINGKVDRALERTRRAAIAMLDSSTSKNPDDGCESVQALLGTLVDAFEASLWQKPNEDLLTRCLDTLFVLARTALNPIDPRTYVPAHDYLTRATSLLRIRVPDTANYTRYVSGAFYNLGATMYQAGRHGTAIGFLKDACVLGVEALRMWKKESIVGTKGEGKKEKAEDGWRQLEEQLYRRWELLAVCFSKIGDRKQAFEAFLKCIKTFPYSKSGFVGRTKERSLQAVFDTSSSTKQLATMIDRVTYLGVCELLLDAPLVSLRSIEIDDACITGALIERQIDSLEGSRWKEGVQNAVAQLSMDVLGMYGPDMPVRRARVLLKCMEFAYHAGPAAVVQIGTPEEMGSEVERLLSQNLRQDTGLVLFCMQYQASAHLWLALHAHRRMDTEQSALVAHHSDQACKILKSVILTEPKSARKSSPKQANITKKSALGPPARQRLMRKVIPPREPITPKPKARKALQPMSLNVVTPPRQNDVVKPLLVFDDLEKLVSLLQLTARVSGLLALILPKVHILDVVRKLCQQQLGIQSDGYILASIDMAHEYVKLRKTKRAASIFNQALSSVKSGNVSDEASTLFFLRFAESLAIAEDVAGSTSVYCEALALSDRFDVEDKGLPSLQRIQLRAKRLERAAMASHVFALIQHSKDQVPKAFDGLLKSLRLWNRAVDTLMRLNLPPTPASGSTDDANPFQMTTLKDVLLTVKADTPSKALAPTKMFSRRPSADGLEWRVSEGLLVTLFSLSQAYLNQGSVREAEYFAQQAQDLAESLNIPTMVSRALATKGEIKLYQGQLEASHDSLTKASEWLKNMPGIDNADVRRLRGVYNERTARPVDASQLYEETINMIDELDQAFKNFDGLAFGRKSIGASPPAKHANEVILPELLAALLRQRIWLLRDNNAEEYTTFLDRFLSLPRSSRTKAEENALMAKLTLHAAYGRFRADMFLSSLTESTIALPMGMSSKNELPSSPQTQDILGTLDGAEALFWANLTLIAQRGSVLNVRDTVISLALIRAFQTSLGKSGPSGPALTLGLLDASAAITLRREMLEAIQHKFPYQPTDDLEWPLLNGDGISPSPLQPKISRHPSFVDGLDSDEDKCSTGDRSLREYWNSVRTRYQSQIFDPSSLSTSQMTGLPSNWTVVHINVTEDKSTLFITRQEGGEEPRIPLIFCVPLKGRRDNGSGQDEEEHLSFEDALNELRDIVRLSDEGTKSAIHVKTDDQAARTAWWKKRMELDTRMRELLENVEFCWLGAFKTILSPRPNLAPDMIHDLRAQFEKIFLRSLHIQDKKTKQRASAHRKTASQGPSQFPSQVTFDDAILECFSTLSPKCRDEELEDLVYFILDLYQFHGVPIAIAEVDIVQVVVDLRAVLEDHAMKLSRRRLQGGQEKPDFSDEHMFLVLDKNLQGLPWESIPILRGRSVSRIPSVDFLHDRILYAKWKRDSLEQSGCPTKTHAAVVDPRIGHYILNPSGDLGRTESRFKTWAAEMEEVGWQGITGHPPSEQQFLDALQRQDLVVYFGHGGGEQYLRSHKIRNLPTCAATMLWGCSSGTLREMGDFDRTGTPYNYMMAGCPTLVANLWDVTDKDIDKFSQSVFDKLRLTAKGIKQWSARNGDLPVSVVTAVAQSRDSCKLKFLTGSAPVVYGIPFYL